MPLSGTVKFNASLILTAAIAGGAIPSYSPVFDWTWQVVTGVGSGQADKAYVANLSLAASANADIDVVSGIIDVFGVAIASAKLKLFAVYAADANPGTITLSRPAANGVTIFAAASDAIVLAAGALFAYGNKLAGHTLAAGTGDLLNVVAAATAGTYNYTVAVVTTSA